MPTIACLHVRKGDAQHFGENDVGDVYSQVSLWCFTVPILYLCDIYDWGGGGGGGGGGSSQAHAAKYRDWKLLFTTFKTSMLSLLTKHEAENHKCYPHAYFIGRP